MKKSPCDVIDHIALLLTITKFSHREFREKKQKVLVLNIQELLSAKIRRDV